MCLRCLKKLNYMPFKKNAALSIFVIFVISDDKVQRKVKYSLILKLQTDVYAQTETRLKNNNNNNGPTPTVRLHYLAHGTVRYSSVQFTETVRLNRFHFYFFLSSTFSFTKLSHFLLCFLTIKGHDIILNWADVSGKRRLLVVASSCALGCRSVLSFTANDVWAFVCH